MEFVFDVDKFINHFPEFNDREQYPDERLILNFEYSQFIIKPQTTAYLKSDQLERVVFLSVAHITTLQTNADNTAGMDQQGIVGSASIGGVSVSMQPPPYGTSQWSWWLNTTQYGQLLLAILEGMTAGGVYIGGSNERKSYRKESGRF